jgi:hypothetical protein
MLLTIVTGAQADRAGFEKQAYEEILFYGNFDEEILLFAGGTAEDYCNGDEPTHEARVFHRSDDSVDIKVNASRQPIYLYETPLSAPALVDATCKVLSDDDPDTVPLEPFAVGDGLVRIRIKIAPRDGPVHVVNSTVGTASSIDGTTWKVRGWANLMIVGGAPAGDPSEFQGLRVSPTGA